MKYFELTTEVAGGLGDNTLPNQMAGTVVSHLHYECDGWMGDAIVGTCGYYIATLGLASKISEASLTGVQFLPAEISVSDEFEFFKPGFVLPPFVRLDPIGMAGHDDFGMGPRLSLVVSERALAVIRSSPSKHSDIINCACISRKYRKASAVYCWALPIYQAGVERPGPPRRAWENAGCAGRVCAEASRPAQWG